MPELPEVETTLSALRPLLSRARILKVEILRKEMVRDPEKLESVVKNLKVKKMHRHGKYMFIDLENGFTIVLHLRMSGRLALRKYSDLELRHERLRFHLDKGIILVFNDPRTLGRIDLLSTDSLKDNPSLKNLGPDALAISEKEFLERLEKRKGTLKALLLNQSFVAGIGNIYADETCFSAGIDPRRKTETLTSSERKKLFHSIIETLKKGIKNRGTSISDFLGVHGKPGTNQKKLLVYGRKGKSCLACGTTLKSVKIQQRTTVWCSKCQK